MRKINAISIMALILTLPIVQNSYAQYVWLNEKGAKQFSDQPPPKNVPRDKILKSPGNRMRTAEAASGESTPASTTDTKSEVEKLQKPQTVASKNEDFNKRKIAREEAEKKAESEKQLAQDKEKNCNRAKSYQQSIDNGMVIATRDQNGERVILDESQRARELADAKKVISSDCK